MNGRWTNQRRGGHIARDEISIQCITQYKKGKDRDVAQGKRRYDSKQSGYGGQTKPVFCKKVTHLFSN